MTGQRFREVINDLLCLVNTEEYIVDFAPGHQVFHLIPVGLLIVILDETHNGCVVRKLQHLRQQSWVTRVNSKVLRTKPCGEPVFREMLLFTDCTNWVLYIDFSQAECLIIGVRDSLSYTLAFLVMPQLKESSSCLSAACTPRSSMVCRWLWLWQSL